MKKLVAIVVTLYLTTSVSDLVDALPLGVNNNPVNSNALSNHERMIQRAITVLQELIQNKVKLE